MWILGAVEGIVGRIIQDRACALRETRRPFSRSHYVPQSYDYFSSGVPFAIVPESFSDLT